MSSVPSEAPSEIREARYERENAVRATRLKKCTTRRHTSYKHPCTLMLLCSCALMFLCGCNVLEFVRPEGPPFYEQISESYYRTELKTSSSADVLAMINIPEYELLSQSKSVVASLGQKKKGRKIWLKMVAFDENELTVQRKYLLIVDERPKFLFVEPWESLSFDCEMVLGSEVLDEPYADENARRIAILKQVLENVRVDVDELSSDNKMIDICGMLINQALKTVLVKLDSSPVLAAGLSDPAGFEFEHTSFDKGRIKMVVTDDIVTVQIRLGSLVKRKLDLSDIFEYIQRPATEPSAER